MQDGKSAGERGLATAVDVVTVCMVESVEGFKGRRILALRDRFLDNLQTN